MTGVPDAYPGPGARSSPTLKREGPVELGARVGVVDGDQVGARRIGVERSGHRSGGRARVVPPE